MTVIDVSIKGTRNLLMHSTAGMLVPKSKKVKSSEQDRLRCGTLFM